MLLSFSDVIVSQKSRMKVAFSLGEATNFTRYLFLFAHSKLIWGQYVKGGRDGIRIVFGC